MAVRICDCTNLGVYREFLMLKTRWIMLGLFMPLTASAAELNKLNDNLLWIVTIFSLIVMGVVSIALVCSGIGENAKSCGCCRNQNSGGSANAGSGADSGGWGDCGGDGGGCGGD